MNFNVKKMPQNNTLYVLIDTSFVKKIQYNFQHNIFQVIYDFRTVMDYQLLIPEIVYRELTEHIKKQSNDSAENISSAIRKTPYSFRPKDGFLKEIYSKKKEDFTSLLYDTALKNYNSFLEESVTLLPVHEDILNIVLDKYFKKEPPFSIKKKYEFPDALSLISFQRYKEENNILSEHVVALTGDNDWISFLKNIGVTNCFADADQAINYFSTFYDEKQKLLIKKAEDYVDNNKNILEELINSRIEINFDDSFIDLDFSYDLENIECKQAIPMNGYVAVTLSAKFYVYGSFDDPNSLYDGVYVGRFDFVSEPTFTVEIKLSFYEDGIEPDWWWYDYDYHIDASSMLITDPRDNDCHDW